MQKIPDRIDSKFRYVLLSAARAEQIIRGPGTTDEQRASKVTRVAMDEIADDAVEWDYGPALESEIEEVAEEKSTETGEEAAR